MYLESFDEQPNKFNILECRWFGHEYSLKTVRFEIWYGWYQKLIAFSRTYVLI